MTTVLLHGLGSDRRQPLGIFEPVVQAVSGPDELIVAPDVRAHGGFLSVGEPADFHLDRLAAEICEQVPASLVDAHPGHGEPDDAVTLIGISMGAAIALRIAMLGLLPVRRAVFVRPAFDDRSLPDNLRPFPVIGQILADAGPAGADEFRERAIFQHVLSVSPAGAAEFQERAIYRELASSTPAGGRALLAQFQAPDAARRAMRLVEIPRNRAFADDAELEELTARGIRSLVVGAPRDPVHPFGIAERWAGGLHTMLELVPARDDGQALQTSVLRERVARWLQRD